MKRTPQAIWTVVLLVVVALGFVTAAGCSASRFINYRVTPDYPRSDRDQTVPIPGLTAAVQVRLDGAGIPYVEAANDLDLARALGYLHGRERYFQMDSLRRFARGRISELLGDVPFGATTTVQQDLRMRAWGIDGAAVAEAALLGPDARIRMQAYVDGVNGALAIQQPIEHRLVGLLPQPWTIEDSLAVGLLNAWTLTTNWPQEAARFLLAYWGGIDRATRIYPFEPGADAVTLSESDSVLRPLPSAVAPGIAQLFPGKAPPASQGGKELELLELSYAPLRGGASNAWAVAGGRSASGQAMVAGDPHLGHMLPGLMMPTSLRAPGLEVIGFTVPGLPSLLIGHNRHVAWSLTAAVADGADLYIERACEGLPNAVEVPGGACEPLRKVPLVIGVLDKKGVMQQRSFEVRASRHGNLLNDMYPDVIPADAPLLAVQWMSGGLWGTVAALDNAARATSVDSLRDGMASWAVPGQNVTAADDAGSITTFVVGRFPVRKAHRGTFPVPGWLADYDWKEFVPYADLPGGKRSGDAFVVHSNNFTVVPGSSPRGFVQAEAAPPYRYQRVAEMLQATVKQTPDTFAAIQTDLALLQARRVGPRMLEDLVAQRFDDPQVQGAVDVLRGWDHVATVDSAGAALFYLTWREAAFLAMGDEADKAGVTFLLSNGYGTTAIDACFDDARHAVWDDRRTPQLETRADAVRAAFVWAVRELSKTQGSDPVKWRWGPLHMQKFQHAFGGLSSLASFVNLKPREAGGGQDSVWKSQAWMGKRGSDFTVSSGPVLRMILDFADIDHARWVVDTGVSGWPGSPHYGDQNELWRTGKYLPMLFNPDDVRVATKATLTLVPAPVGRPAQDDDCGCGK
jgi:penicillin amidase